MTKLSVIKRQWLKDPNVKKHYESLSEEFQIASCLIKARIESGLTQAEVAKKMKTTQSVIARLESGHALPSMNSILRYANVVGYAAKLVLTPKNK